MNIKKQFSIPGCFLTALDILCVFAVGILLDVSIVVRWCKPPGHFAYSEALPELYLDS